jgi:hypothetical protein
MRLFEEQSAYGPCIHQKAPTGPSRGDTLIHTGLCTPIPGQGRPVNVSGKQSGGYVRLGRTVVLFREATQDRIWWPCDAVWLFLAANVAPASERTPGPSRSVFGYNRVRLALGQVIHIEQKYGYTPSVTGSLRSRDNGRTLSGATRCPRKMKHVTGGGYGYGSWVVASSQWIRPADRNSAPASKSVFT